MTDVYKALAGRIDELKIIGDGKDIRIEELEADLDRSGREIDEKNAGIEQLSGALLAADARAAELEKQLGEAPATKARVEYLERGLGRLIVEAYKLRKGVL